ncbi:nucleotide kinase [Thermoplasmatales archaeon ex4572_165]|nr:MAG: nucleotide kinase [Thermoplasmatales archaeon ex4572_165]RLF58922.1 MAG: nucleotide kinase [Thermoplasmata archaeon]
MDDIPKIGITGMPHVGKTESLKRIIGFLEDAGYSCQGMITESVIEKEEHVGFEIVNWKSGEKDVFAHVDFEDKDQVGEYGVDIGPLENIGIPAIEQAITDDNIHVIIIDEIGKMEMLSEPFCDTVISALDSDKPIMVTLHKKSRTPLLQDVRRRDDIRILEVTPVNRNLLPYKIEKIMREKLPPLY